MCFERSTAREALTYFWNCQTLGVSPAEPGAYQGLVSAILPRSKPTTFARPNPSGRPPLSRGPGLIILLLGLVALCASRADLAGSEWHVATHPVPTAPILTLQEPESDDPIPPSEPALTELTGIIGRGEVFSEALKRQGLGHDAVFELVLSLRKGIHRAEFNPNIVQRGDRYRVGLDTAGVVQTFEFVKRGAIATRFVAVREQGELVARKEQAVLDRQVVVVSGGIEGTIWNAIRTAGENPDLLSSRLIEIFEYDIDFMVDCRPDDAFAVAVEKLYKDGEFVRYGDVLAAQYRASRDTYHAYLFETPEGDRGYHDAEGRSLRGIFLKSPLNYRRINSGYTSRRFHPVLKKYLAHHGIDYAADYGTPVWATADGVVVFSGRKGALGTYVEVQHKNGYKTGYGHLSRISRTIRKGARIKQKQIVGYVGATGRATGPHLHYNFYSKVGGKHRLTNPSRVVNRPTGKTVPPTLLERFAAHRDHLDALLAWESGSIVTAHIDLSIDSALDYPTE